MNGSMIALLVAGIRLLGAVAVRQRAAALLLAASALVVCGALLLAAAADALTVQLYLAYLLALFAFILARIVPRSGPGAAPR